MLILKFLTQKFHILCQTVNFWEPDVVLNLLADFYFIYAPIKEDMLPIGWGKRISLYLKLFRKNSKVSNCHEEKFVGTDTVLGRSLKCCTVINVRHCVNQMLQKALLAFLSAHNCTTVQNSLLKYKALCNDYQN